MKGKIALGAALLLLFALIALSIILPPLLRLAAHLRKMTRQAEEGLRMLREAGRAAGALGAGDAVKDLAPIQAVAENATRLVESLLPPETPSR